MNYQFLSIHLYLTYYAACGKEEAAKAVEEYTDVLLAVLLDSYPNAELDAIVFSWKVPSVNEDSLYAAYFWCENTDGAILRGEGSGLVYQ